MSVGFLSNSFPSVYFHTSSVIPKTLTGLATLAAGWYFGSNTMYLLGGSILGNSLWTWHQAPHLQMPANNGSLNEAGLRKLYHDMQLCGLDGENRAIAQRRYMEFYQAVAQGTFVPEGEDAVLIKNISQVLARKIAAPSLETIAFDIGSLYAETAANGFSSSHKRRFNELLQFITSHADSVSAPDLHRLLVIQATVQRGNSPATTPATVSHDIRSLLYSLQREGVKNPEEVRRKIASFEIHLADSPLKDEAMLDLNIIKSLLAAGAISIGTVSATSSDAARGISDAIQALATDVMPAEAQGTLASGLGGLRARYNAIDVSLLPPSSEELQLHSLVGGILIQAAAPPTTTGTASVASAITSVPTSSPVNPFTAWVAGNPFLSPTQKTAIIDCYITAQQASNPKTDFYRRIEMLVARNVLSPGKAYHVKITSGFTLHPTMQRLNAMATRDGVVDFYHHNKPLTQVFGNFYLAPVTITINGISYTFRCSEAAYHAGKYVHRPDLIQQLTQLDGEGSYRFSRDNAQSNIPGWTTLDAFGQTTFGSNVAWMRMVLEAKYLQNPILMDLLLSTEDAYLVEHNPVVGRDTAWSDNNNGTGSNMLGRLLMELRERWNRRPSRIMPPSVYLPIIARREASGIDYL